MMLHDHEPPHEAEVALDVLDAAGCTFDVDDTDLIAKYHPDCVGAASVLRGYGHVDNAITIRAEIESEAA